MDKHIKAMEILESLPQGWEWSISKTGDWYYCIIRNDGLIHEPVYTSAGMSPKQPKRGFVSLDTPESRDILCHVQFAYDEYVKGEAAQKILRATA